MSTISPVNGATPTNTSQKKSSFNSVKVTGYASLGFGLASAAAGVRKKIKLHKYFAYISLLAAVIHTGIIEWYHFNKKK